MKLASRLSRFGGSPTMAAKQAAADLQRQGIEVIDFSVGEPDFPTPAHVVDAAKAALDGGETHYSEGAGEPRLRQALAHHLGTQADRQLSPDEIVVTSGGKSALFYVFLALVEHGDEVVLPAPCWVSFPDQIRLAGGVPVMVPCAADNHFRPQTDDLVAALTPKSRAIVINSPANPSGAVMSAVEWDRLAAVVRERDLWLISDETYEHFVYGSEPVRSAVSRSRSLKDRLVVVNSFSKTYAMTGWRVGYVWTNPDLARALTKLQSQDTTHPATFCQHGAIAALEGPDGALQEMKAEYAVRRQLVMTEMASLPGFRCSPPDGAFYVFPDVTEAMRAKDCPDDAQFAHRLLTEAHVAVVPGSAFAGPGCIRISYAASREQIREGMARIRRWMQSSPPTSIEEES